MVYVKNPIFFHLSGHRHAIGRKPSEHVPLGDGPIVVSGGVEQPPSTDGRTPLPVIRIAGIRELSGK